MLALTTLTYFGWPCTGMPDEQREGLQEELIDIILVVLKRNPQLHYYQGYHDIVVTFLLVLGERLATALVEKLSTHHLRCIPNTSSSASLYSTTYFLSLAFSVMFSLIPPFTTIVQLCSLKRLFVVCFLFRDFMDPTMDNTKHILNYLMPIIERVNPEVHDFMQQ